ncbi:MAG: DUF2141 domain-containing protein [bacterium]
MKYAFMTILIFTTVIISAENKGSLTIDVTGVKKTGKVYVAVFNKAEGFPMDSDNAFRRDMKKAEEKKLTFIFSELPFGAYAISVWHDENDNGKFDTNFLGIPKEGVGVSNNAKGMMGPPKFKDAKFLFKKNKLNISIPMNY